MITSWYKGSIGRQEYVACLLVWWTNALTGRERENLQHSTQFFMMPTSCLYNLAYIGARASYLEQLHTRGKMNWLGFQGICLTNVESPASPVCL